MTDSRAPEVAGVGLTFFLLALVFVALRTYVRLVIRKNWAADDWLMVGGLLCFFAYGLFGVFGIKYGIGQHVASIVSKNPKNLPQALMYWYICELLYTASTAFTRTSVALLLLRICERKTHIVIICITMIVVILYSMFYLLLDTFQCDPPSYFWEEFNGASGTCIDPKIIASATYGHIAVSATADWVLGLLPIWMIWDLNMDIRTKMSTGVVLSLGLVAGIVAVLRGPEVVVLAVTDDFLWNMVKISNLSSTEAGLLLIACGACTLRPLLTKYLNFSNPNPSSGLPNQPTNRKSRGSKLRDRYGRMPSHAGNDNETANIEMEAMEMGVGGNTSTMTDADHSDSSLAEDKAADGIRTDRIVSIKFTDSIGMQREGSTESENDKVERPEELNSLRPSRTRIP